MNVLTPFILLLITGSIYSQNLKEYYYNLDSLFKPKVYTYTCLEDSSKTQYWKVHSNTEKRVLITEAYDAGFKKVEHFIELYVDSGSTLWSFQLVDGKKITHTRVEDKDVFKWDITPPYSYSVKYKEGNQEVTFKKTRTYFGKNKVRLMGKEYEAIEFKGDYSFNYDPYGYKQEYTQVSYYTKKHGLAKYVRILPDKSVRTLTLTSILSENEWEKLKKGN